MSAFSQLFKRKDEAPPAPALPVAPAVTPIARPALHAVENLLPLQAELARVTGLDEMVMRDAAKKARESGDSIGNVLLNMGQVSRADLIEAQYFAKAVVSIDKLGDMPRWDTLVHVAKTRDVVAIGDAADAGKRGFVVSVVGNGNSGTETRAMTAANALRSQGWKMSGRIQVSADFMRLLESDYMDRKAGKQEGEATSPENESLLQADFFKLAHLAFTMRASDIHITCVGGVGRVKFRIDGELETYQDWTEDYTRAMARAIYNTTVEAGSTNSGFSDIEKQDAAIEKIFPEGLLRFRYASIPITPKGFSITMRIIPVGVNKKQQNMADLGYSDDQQADLDRMFAHSSGLIFFLGTTGSGKSTSMAVALEGVARAKPGKKIRTVEQPVEYRIAGTEQTSVDREGFIDMISQLMRMDPDYMMVGETRDNETAAAVLQGARSGHLCVSTLHADGAPLAYDRLQGLGVPRSELASVGLVVGIVYQKLVPVLCTSCKITAHEHADIHPHDPILKRVRQVNDNTLEGVYFARMGGCPECRGRGFKGRTVCAEILRPRVSMLSAIAAGNSRELWRAWRATIDHDHPEVMRGRTAFEHAIWKMRQGEVSPDAVENEFRFLDEPPFEDIEG